MRHQHAFDLPQESLDVTPARAATAGQLRGLTMLVVEDDSDARYIFRRMLTLEGALVLEAPEGVAALALCRSNARIDVILCHLLMPSLDGFGFVRGLCARTQTILSVTPPKTRP
jgi:CheY-like chemotaxis protein